MDINIALKYLNKHDNNYRLSSNAPDSSATIVYWDSGNPDTQPTTSELTNAWNAYLTANSSYDANNPTISTVGIPDNSITNAKMADDAIGLDELSATGTPSSSNFLRGDNTWATPSTTDSTKMPLTGGTFTGSVTFEDAINENVYAITDATSPALNPNNGMIQTWTLNTGSISGTRTPSDSIAAGQSMLLMIDDGDGTDAVTFPTMTWVGGNAPTLATSGYTVIELWKVSSTLYGAHVGDVA